MQLILFLFITDSILAYIIWYSNKKEHHENIEGAYGEAGKWYKLKMWCGFLLMAASLSYFIYIGINMQK